MGRTRIAVVGAGYMGSFHAAKFAASADAELVAVVDTDRARAVQLAGKLGCAAETDYRSLLPRLDAACVSVPTEHHHAIARACLEAGLHVLVEKPLARSLAEADALLALAVEKSLVLQVGHLQRFNPAFQALAADSGRPLFIDIERLAPFKARGTDVDVILDLMIHDLDLVLALAKAPVEQISASGFRVLTEAIDIANARIEFADGCIASVSASRVSQAPVRKLRVFQTDLYVSADLQAGRLRYVKQSGGAIEEMEENHAGGDALAVQAEQFVLSILKKEPAGVDGESGARALQLAIEVGRLVRERLQRFG